MRRLIVVLLACMVALAAAPISVKKHATSGGGGLSDNFDTDTSANWFAVYPGTGMVPSGGTLHGQNTATSNFAYYTTSLGSPDQTLTVTGQVVDATNYFDVGLRAASASQLADTYIIVFAPNDYPNLQTMIGGTVTWRNAFFDCGMVSATPWTHKIKVSVSGSTFHLWMDMNDNGFFGGEGTGEDCGTATDTNITTGNFVALGAVGTAVLDNFSATTP